MKKLLNKLPQSINFGKPLSGFKYPKRPSRIPSKQWQKMKCTGLLEISRPNGWVITYAGYYVCGSPYFVVAGITQDADLEKTVKKTLAHLKKLNLR